MKTHLNHQGNSCDCDLCREGLEAVKQREQAALLNYGWYIHAITKAPEFPFGKNYHTHGLPESHGHMDLQICCAIPPNKAADIFHTVIQKYIKNGKRLEVGKTYGELIAPSDPILLGMTFDVLILEASEGNRQVLRLIFPGRIGEFDGELSLAQMEGCKSINR